MRKEVEKNNGSTHGLPKPTIHDRKATAVSPLRRKMLDLIGTLLTKKEGQRHCRCVIHNNTTISKKTIRMVVDQPVWSGGGKKRLVFQVIIDIIAFTRDVVTGQIKKITHHFPIEYPVTFGAEQAAA